MSSQNEITIDGKPYIFEDGETILDVATRNDIYIPTLCHLKGTVPTGACRVCLVDVEGARNLTTSCTMPASNNMIVHTDTPKVIQARRFVIALIMVSGSHNCAIGAAKQDDWTDYQLDVMEYDKTTELCDAYGICKLQELAYKYQVADLVKELNLTAHKPKYELEDVNPFITRDFSRCILCGRCVKACNEVVVNRVISIGYRGIKSKIVTSGDSSYIDSDCVFCGQCLEVCPVGALIDKKARGLSYKWEENIVRSTCPYCGVGCQIWLHVKDCRIVKVSAVEDGAPNMGRLCVKGRFGYDFIYSDERLKTPLIKEKNGFREASWDEALDMVAEKFKKIISEHGADAIAGVSCARSINEDSYQMQKLFRAVIGTNNIDHCART